MKSGNTDLIDIDCSQGELATSSGGSRYESRDPVMTCIADGIRGDISDSDLSVFEVSYNSVLILLTMHWLIALSHASYLNRNALEHNTEDT